jgi:hypothetical protein
VTTVARYITRTPARAGQTRRRVTGTPEEVAATVALVRQSGRFLAVTTPRHLDPADLRVTVIVTLRTHDGPISAPRAHRRWVKPIVIATAGTATLASTGYGLVVLVQHLARAVVSIAPALVGGLAVLTFVLMLATCAGRGGCVGLHCPGCGRH